MDLGAQTLFFQVTIKPKVAIFRTHYKMGSHIWHALKQFLQSFASKQYPTREALEANTDLLIVDEAMESQERFLVEG